MTTSRELQERLDHLPPDSLERIASAIAKEEQIQRHLEALRAFQTDWTPEEQAAWDEGTKRRPFRTVPLEES